MTVFMTYALIGYMVGVVLERFVSGEVGLAVRIVAAVLFVLAWLVGFIR